VENADDARKEGVEIAGRWFARCAPSSGGAAERALRAVSDGPGMAEAIGFPIERAQLSLHRRAGGFRSPPEGGKRSASPRYVIPTKKNPAGRQNIRIRRAFLSPLQGFISVGV